MGNMQELFNSPLQRKKGLKQNNHFYSLENKISEK